MPDWGGLVDKGLGKLEDGWEAGKEKVGEGVDWATDKVGDGLEYVHQDAIADVIEDWGDRTASSLGAEVGEQQLGQSEQADELIHGNTSKINASVKNLRDFKAAFDLVGRGMKGLDSSHWKGAAADAFREKFTTLPTDWLRVADAFDDAARALEACHDRDLGAGQGAGSDRPLQAGQRDLEVGGHRVQQEGRRLQGRVRQQGPAS